jgi:hypothetical protein
MMGKVLLRRAFMVKVVRQCGVGVDAWKIGWRDSVRELRKELLV